jgi:hypothetical protein
MVNSDLSLAWLISEFQKACIKAANKTTPKTQFVTMVSNL